MLANFDFALEHIFQVEGKKFTDIPEDRGGPTKFGITQRTLQSYLGYVVSREDVMNMTEELAGDIYEAIFWKPLKLDKLNHHIALALFNQAVHRGPNSAVKSLQSVLRMNFQKPIAEDGIIGQKTIEAANSVPEERLLIRFLCQCQHHYLEIWRADPSQAKFVRGWIARTWTLFDLL